MQVHHLRMRPRRTLTWLAAAVVFPLAIAGCSSSKPPAARPLPTAEPTPSAAASPSPTDELQAAKASVLTAYQAWWKAIEQTQTSNDVNDPSLAATMDGPVFRHVVDELTIASGNHTYYRGLYGLKAITVTLKNPAGPATVTDCVDASQVQIYDTRTHKATGRKAGLADNGYTVTLKSVTGTWKVTAFTLTGGRCS
jgi:hypothetical protein